MVYFLPYGTIFYSVLDKIIKGKTSRNKGYSFIFKRNTYNYNL